MMVKGIGSCCLVWFLVGDDDDYEDGGIGLCDFVVGVFFFGQRFCEVFLVVMDGGDLDFEGWSLYNIYQ